MAEIYTLIKRIKLKKRRETMKEDLSQKYSKEICMACESMTYGKRKFTLPQKSRLLENFYKYSKKKQLVGPIADGSAQGYDAVLLRRGQQNAILESFANVLVKKENGEIEEKIIHFDFCSARNYPGNHLVIIESKTGIGIYEDTNKKEKDPIFQKYEKKLEKVELNKFIHQMAQMFFFPLACLSVIFSCYCVRYEAWYVKLFVSFIASLVYPFILKRMKKYYIKKYGEEIFENIFSQVGIFFYLLLLLLVMVCSFGPVLHWN